MSTPGCAARRPDEQGSATAELVLVTPLLFLLMLLVVLAGRTTDARLQVESAAHQAARAASIARDPTTAAGAAQNIAKAALATEWVSCTALQVDTDTRAHRPGGTVTVTVTCTIDLHDLILLGVPGTIALSATVTSPIDRWRADAESGVRP